MSSGIQLEEAGFAYPQDGRGLQALSLSIEKGEGVLFAGLSGCGKSTLARCLVGLIPHLYRGQMQGKIWLDEMLTSDTPLWQLTQRAGLVFQNPAAQMLASTVEEEIIFGLENLGLPADIIRTRTVEALQTFHLEHLCGRAPQTLSGGEQQKVALASILARRPLILILDEPLSMLDTSSAFEFVSMLDSSLQEGRTVVICEHRREYLQAVHGLRTVKLEGRTYREQPAGRTPVVNTSLNQTGGQDFQIEVAHLSVERGGQKILDDLNFNLKSGKVVAVVGPNGAGKTTLLRSLAGIQKSEGQISALEQGRSVIPEFGMVFQNPDLQLFNATVREEILYRLPNVDRERYAWLLNVLDLERYEEDPPLLLSEGEKRRVALATALMRQPRHGILLDEPSLGQDALHKTTLVSALRSVADTGLVVLMATHDLELAASADRMILLSARGILADGPSETVIRDRAAWDRLGLRVPPWVVDE